MKRQTLILILISLLFQVPATALTVDLDRMDAVKGEAVISRDRGYYMDGRGQVPEYSRIAPPHEENIPKQPRATKTVVGWDRYYQINKEGYRPMGYQMPLVPNYNVHYSNRRAVSSISVKSATTIFCPFFSWIPSVIFLTNNSV